jgi:hypothetical protein
MMCSPSDRPWEIGNIDKVFEAFETASLGRSGTLNLEHR